VANADRPNGFEPVLLIRSRPYAQDASDTTATFVNDVVEAEADGYISPAAAGSTLILGSALNYSAASTANTVSVADHPDQEFHAQDDGVGTTLTKAHIFSNCDHIAGAGSTITKKSGHEIDISSTVATAAGFLLLDIVANVDNAVGANAILRVECAEHIKKDQIAV